MPHYVGSRLVEGLTFPSERVRLVNTGGIVGLASEALFKLFGVSPGMVRSLKRLDPVLLHAHFGPDGVRAMPLARSVRKPLIVTFHGFDATMTDECAKRSKHYGHRDYIRRRPELIRSAARVIAVSQFIRGRLLDQGFPSEKVLVHYIGVDTAHFSPDQLGNREPVVLFVGRLAEKKGCKYLLDAMQRAQAKCPNWKLVIIGDGPLRAELELSAQEKLRNCTFLGVQAPLEIRKWMNIASIFCAPSTIASSGDAEGFGMVFAEAQAMGLPVVSFATGGVPEAVAHGATGFLAPDQDVDALAEYLLLLVNDSGLRKRMGEDGRQRVCRQFDLRKQTAILEQIYADVIAEAR
jgi:glycosyltransferase involved in cell wall biosynthesis